MFVASCGEKFAIVPQGLEFVFPSLLHWIIFRQKGVERSTLYRRQLHSKLIRLAAPQLPIAFLKDLNQGLLLKVDLNPYPMSFWHAEFQKSAAENTVFVLYDGHTFHCHQSSTSFLSCRQKVRILRPNRYYRRRGGLSGHCHQSGGRATYQNHNDGSRRYLITKTES